MIISKEAEAASDIIRAVAKESGMTTALLMSERGSQRVVQARWRVFQSLEGRGWSQTEISSIFVRSNGKTMLPSTVSYALRKMRNAA